MNLKDLEKNVIQPLGKIPFSDFDKLNKELFAAAESGKADFTEELTLDGMVKRLKWDRKKVNENIVLLINAGDPLGVMIDGFKSGDTIRIVSVHGTASFTGGTSIFKKILSGGVVVGAEVGKFFTDESTDKEIDEVAKRIKNQLKEKKRDGYGQENPPNGRFHTHEGGVLVCVHSDIYYSGTNDRHIKEHKPRLRDVQPDSIPFERAFFIVPPEISGALQHNTRKLEKDGSIVVVAYDSKFSDNVGLYKVKMEVTKGPK